MRFLLLIGVVTWHVTNSNAMAVEGTKANALEAVTQSANTFASNFFKSIVEDVKGNLICSPISASMVLSMAAYGAGGNTEKQLRTSLALPENDALARDGFRAFVDSLSNYKQVELRLANKMFIGNGIKPKAEFAEMTKAGFDSEAQNVNFAEAAEASKTINDWCEAQTNNRIKDLIKPDDLNAATALVLVNAVYFKGNWAEKFDAAKTEPRPFHVDGTKEENVPTMFRKGSYRYGELPELKAKFIELPYKSDSENDSISMFIILPDEINGLPELEKNIEKVTMEKLRGYSREVNLYLPKFKIESDIPLNEALVRMGMSDMFTDAANFTGIVDSPPLQVSKVIQKAFIEVNEEGSEAAAATGIKIAMRCMTYPKEMKVDRPFVYRIVANRASEDGTRNGYELFTGIVVNPQV